MSSRIKNILVIVDPTATEHPAVEKAALLAEKFRARLELYACETKESRAARYATHLQQGGSADFVAHIRAVIEAVAQPLRQRGLDVTTEAAFGDPLYAKLLERTKTTCADLVVKDTHHHSILRRTLITNTDWHLIRGCPVPLLLTKPKKWAAAPVVAAAVDPGHVNDKPVVLDNRILDWAREFRDRLEGSLHVVHAYLPAVLVAEAASGMPAMMSTLTPKLLEEEQQRALERVAELVSPYGVAPENITVEMGVASEVLPRFAERIGADILAMGAISRSGLQRILIGSTAERVLEYVPCDILVIKPPDFAATLPF
jgi:universal stress protein E